MACPFSGPAVSYAWTGLPTHVWTLGPCLLQNTAIWPPLGPLRGSVLSTFRKTTPGKRPWKQTHGPRVGNSTVPGTHVWSKGLWSFPWPQGLQMALAEGPPIWVWRGCHLHFLTVKRGAHQLISLCLVFHTCKRETIIGRNNRVIQNGQRAWQIALYQYHQLSVII